MIKITHTFIRVTFTIRFQSIETSKTQPFQIVFDYFDPHKLRVISMN